MMIRLVPAATPEHWRAAGQLVQEYAESLGVSLDFQDFDRELRQLAVDYGPPGGVFLLAEQDGAYVGCGAVRRFSASSCEMKRLYVRAGMQGRGVGRRLATALIEQARSIGYRSMLLDTLPTMREAQALYRSLGFCEVVSYRFNPVPGAVFLELTL